MIQQLRNSFLTWCGWADDVEIFRAASEQQVADAAADQVRGVIVFVKPVQDLERVGINVAAGNRML